jgi:hypothetical protein
VLIRFTLAPLPGGLTRITMAEEAVRGWLGAVPAQLQQALWRPRNRETLSRLADLATGRTAGR